MLDNKRFDRISNPNQNGELILPIAHYAFLNAEDCSKIALKCVVFGLGSCIVIILIDPIIKLYSMSHVLLPSSEIKDLSLVKYPHKFVNTSINHLLNIFMQQGSRLEHIKAILIGGATIFNNEFNNIGNQNIEMARFLLNSKGIPIYYEEVGGRKGRTIIYDIINNLISIKTFNGTIIKKIN